MQPCYSSMRFILKIFFKERRRVTVRLTAVFPSGINTKAGVKRGILRSWIAQSSVPPLHVRRPTYQQSLRFRSLYDGSKNSSSAETLCMRIPGPIRLSLSPAAKRKGSSSLTPGTWRNFGRVWSSAVWEAVIHDVGGGGLTKSARSLSWCSDVAPAVRMCRRSEENLAISSGNCTTRNWKPKPRCSSCSYVTPLGSGGVRDSEMYSSREHGNGSVESISYTTGLEAS